MKEMKLPQIEQSILEGLRSLSQEQCEKVAEYVHTLARENDSDKSIWDKIGKRINKISLEVWDNVPQDGAQQHDHYLYGTPKK